MPVVAPGKGATPVGKLCVSAVKQMSRKEERTSNGDGRRGSLGEKAGTSAPERRRVKESSFAFDEVAFYEGSIC